MRRRRNDIDWSMVEDEPVTDDTIQWRLDLLVVKERLKRFGFKPKCAFRTNTETWLLVYENPFAPASARYFIGTFSGTTELYRTVV